MMNGENHGMKLKDGFILRKMPGMNVLMPVGENAQNQTRALVLNDTAAFIYELLQQGLSRQQITEKMTAEYDVTPERAQDGYDKTAAMLIEGGAAE